MTNPSQISQDSTECFYGPVRATLYYFAFGLIWISAIFINSYFFTQKNDPYLLSLVVCRLVFTGIGSVFLYWLLKKQLFFPYPGISGQRLLSWHVCMMESVFWES